MSKKFFHITPIGKGYNIGNFAISLAIRRTLSIIYPGCTIITIPAFGQRDSGISKSLVYEANQWADGLIVGGGNLYENNELNIDFNALLSLKVPIAIFSVSIGRIYYRDNILNRRSDSIKDEDLVKLHKFTTRSISRDVSTQKYLESIGIENSTLGACPTLNLSSIINFKFSKEVDDENIFLSIRNPELMNIPRKLKLELPSIIIKISELIKDKYGFYPKLLCHDQRDISFASSFENLEFFYTSDVYEYLQLLKNTKLVISMRIHATLPCLSYGTPVINLSYDERAMSLMETIGFSEWDINLVLNQKDSLEMIGKRLNNLNKLQYLRNENANIWKVYKDIQFEALSIF